MTFYQQTSLILKLQEYRSDQYSNKAMLFQKRGTFLNLNILPELERIGNFPGNKR